MNKVKKITKKLTSLLMVFMILFSIKEVHAATSEWNNSTSLPTSAGEYKLMTDVVTTSQWNVPGNITLDLNGYGIRYSGSGDANVIVVGYGKKLTLKDSNSTKKNYITLDSNGRGISVSSTPSEGAIEVNGGYITGGKRPGQNFQTSGGGIRIFSGELVMNGGNIVGNNAFLGAGVFVMRSASNKPHGTFTMNGGTIKNNKSGNAAGVNIEYGHMTMTGGSIINNDGPGIRIVGKYKSDLTLSGAPLIKNNGTTNISLGGSKLKISGNLTNSEPIGIVGDDNAIFTTGLSGKGTYSKFVADRGNQRVVNASGEAKLVHTYKVIYDANEGEGSITDSSSPYLSGESVKVLKNLFTRNNYLFIGYNTKADGSGTNYYENNNFNISADTTLYAQWFNIKELLDEATGYYNEIKETYPSIANDINTAIKNVNSVIADNDSTSTENKNAISNLQNALDNAKKNVQGILDAEEKINEIGILTIPTSEAKIKEARTTYDALNSDQKALVNGDVKNALTKAEDDYSKAKEVADKINAIGDVELTAESKGLIDDARATYDALTADQKDIVDRSGYTSILTKAEEDYSNYLVYHDAAKPVVAKIKAIGTVEYTEECKAKINEARAAFDALNENEKMFVNNLYTLTKAEATYAQLEANAKSLELVNEKIDAIGTVEYTDTCKAKIDEARAAYDALTDDQKAIIGAEKLSVLENAEETYNNVKKADDKIKAIGTVEYTDASKTKIDAAKEAYKALTDNEKTLLGTEAKATLDEANSLYNELKENHEAAEAVIAKINAIGDVTYPSSQAKIEEARAAYDALTDDQKALVGNKIEVLSGAETEFAAQKSDAEAVAAVIAKINAIGDVEYNESSQVKIAEAKGAYDALPDKLKDRIENHDTLTTAENTYEKLKTDHEKAEEAMEKINAIGEVKNTDASKAKIDEARAAYDALTADQKALVTDEAKELLTTAEETYQKLKSVEEKIEAIGDVEYTDACKAKIDEARAEYDALTDAQKVLVSSEAKELLASTEYAYNNLKTKYDAANNAIEKISAIKDVEITAEYKAKLDVARAIYDALTDDQKELVSEDVKKILTDSEEKYSVLYGDYYLQITYISADKMTMGKASDLVIRATGDLDKLIEIQINGKKLDSSNYKLEKGSTILTLNQSYLNSLDAGEYKVTFVYNTGKSVDATFTIEKTIKNPQTGDNVLFYILMLGLSMLGLTGAGVYLKKKRFN